MNSPSSRPIRADERGFTLIELLIGMVITVEILVAALTVFDVHNRMTRVQLQVTEVQQALRVAQYDMVRTARMIGRGTLPTTFTLKSGPDSAVWLASRALEVRNNLTEDADRQVAIGFTDTPLVVKGTDMLVERGCISGLLFQVANIPGEFQPDGGTAGVADTGQITLRRITDNGREQPLDELREAGYDGPLLIQSRNTPGIYAVAEVTAVAGNADAVTLQLSWQSAMTPPNPLVGISDLTMAGGFVCTLEEYRYYVRENYAIAGDPTSELLPRLARARMVPGTEVPYKSTLSNLSLDLADQIVDLQVAMAFDTDWDADGSAPGAFDDDNDTLGNDDLLFEGTTDDARAADDWLWNSSTDDPTDSRYRFNAGPPSRPAKLVNLRITTVARTARPDPGYQAPDFDADPDHDWVEDNDYDAAPADVWKQGENRNHRRRLLETTIDMRNV